MRAIPFVLAAISAASCAYAQEGWAGRLQEKVTCEKAPVQAYALYVPSTYTPQQAWPVIFCFDPAAHGLEPVKRLQAAAEKFGCIVAGSLNSRNGPWTDNVVAIQAMVGDVDAHLHLDNRRVYTAGLSGGARVATQLALTGLAKGVIACSAGFPASEEGIPGKIPFVFFGTAGVEDFNYRELRRLDEELAGRQAAHRIVIFEGGHEWAPVALLAEAVEWLALQEMRAGTRLRDEGVVQAAVRARRAALPSAPLGEVWRANKELAADFKGLADTTEFEKNAAELGARRELKDWQKTQRDLLSREELLSVRLAEAAKYSTAEMRGQVAGLRVQAGAASDSDECRIAKRVLAGAMMSVREGVKGLMERGEYDAAVSLLEMGIEIRPEQTRNYFDLARARALGGDRKKALAALQLGAERGFADAARVEDEAAFTKLKSDPAWAALLARLRANPPEPDRLLRERP